MICTGEAAEAKNKITVNTLAIENPIIKINSNFSPTVEAFLTSPLFVDPFAFYCQKFRFNSISLVGEAMVLK